MSEKMKAVQAMMEAWKRRDVEAFLDTLNDDIQYYWHPNKRPAVGKEKMRKFLANYEAGFDQQDWTVRHFAETGNLLFMEGMEVLVNRSTGARLDNPFVQVFEIRDGKISQMRDYYDTAQMQAAAVETPRTEAMSA